MSNLAHSPLGRKCSLPRRWASLVCLDHTMYETCARALQETSYAMAYPAATSSLPQSASQQHRNSFRTCRSALTSSLRLSRCANQKLSSEFVVILFHFSSFFICSSFFLIHKYDVLPLSALFNMLIVVYGFSSFGRCVYGFAIGVRCARSFSNAAGGAGVVALCCLFARILAY